MHEETKVGVRPRRSGTLLVSFLGSVVRRMGNWMPIAGGVELMGQVGLDPPSSRTAVFRLKQRGWLVSETRGDARGYVLTPLAQRALAEGDEVIWHARQPADIADGWCIVNFSVPESERSKRHQLRALVSSLGFGNVGTAMWIAPARMLSAAENAIAELGLDEYAAIFVGDYMGRQDLRSLLSASWDLDAINERYKAFLARYSTEVEGLSAQKTIDPQQAFITYLRGVDHWRKLPFRDPGLPRQVLAADWSAPQAAVLFEQLVSILERRALDYAAGFWPDVEDAATAR
ncbi:MAG: Transcriptional regulator, PaaX family [uncultured Nocardioidaceae bacterium]|uniref:Transcriptional regulator, PaaX family n=1 Tax=uncultured Nocardioidaceae bacterium TaxID=253824 RepID=A0A6J4MRA6_9ACTN|nr:MAG: Transcriptional regulator, PaaX family [uncultured Nocardioidaceae bacterium]